MRQASNTNARAGECVCRLLPRAHCTLFSYKSAHKQGLLWALYFKARVLSSYQRQNASTTSCGDARNVPFSPTTFISILNAPRQIGSIIVNLKTPLMSFRGNQHRTTIIFAAVVETHIPPVTYWCKTIHEVPVLVTVIEPSQFTT